MIASPARAALGLLCAAAVLAALPAHAQTEDGQPLLLIPFDEGGTTDGAGSGGSSGYQTQTGTSSIDGLQVETLEAVDASSAGTLDINSGGFTMDLWSHVDPVLVAALLPRIGAPAGSPTAIDLGRRLLLTAAQPPEAVDLLAVRLDRLNALGFASEVPALAASAGRGALSAAAFSALADARFLGGANEEGCRAVREGLAIGDAEGLQKALIFCQRLAGENAAAELGLAVLQDSGIALEPQFVALDAAMAAGRAGKVESLEGATPLVLAMILATDTPIGPALVGTAAPALQRAIADNALVDIETRLVAGEVATAVGTMRGADLARLYQDTPYDDAEVANALSRAGSMDGAPGRALLYRASRTQTLAAGRAEALAALLHHAAETGGAAAYLAAARAAADEISALNPASELGWFSADASAALLLAGRPEAAARWWPLLQDRAIANDDFRARATVLWPLFRIAFGEQLPPGGAGMTGWWQAMASQPAERRLAMAETYLAAFSAFGDGTGSAIVPEVVALSQTVPGEASRAALLFALGQAAHEGSVGGTVLLALTALGPGGPVNADPVTLQAVIRALDAVGLGLEGRLIAMEAGGQRAIAAP